MNKAERVACAHIFSSYPDYLTFNEIKILCIKDDIRERFNDVLAEIGRDHQQLWLSDQYKYDSWKSIPKMLEELADNAREVFGESK